MNIVREHFTWAVLLFKASIDSYLIIMYSLLHGSLYQICISAFESVVNGSSFGEKYSIANREREELLHRFYCSSLFQKLLPIWAIVDINTI